MNQMPKNSAQEVLKEGSLIFQSYLNNGYKYDGLDKKKKSDEAFEKLQIEQNSERRNSFDKNHKKSKADFLNGWNSIESEASKTQEVQKPSGASSGSNQDKLLIAMSCKILDKIRIIFHEENLYWFNGKNYSLIPDGDELLHLIRIYVSDSGFDATSLSPFPNLFGFMRKDPKLVPEDYNAKRKDTKYLACFENGVFDIRTKTLYPFSEDYLIFNKLAAKYVAGEKPAVFKSFLKRASGGDKEIATRICEVIGYLLLSNNEAKTFFVMGTAPNSGKSLLANMVSELVGEENIENVSTNKLAGKFALGNISNKLINISCDLPNGNLSAVAVSLIKMISGKDKINIEKKFKDAKSIKSDTRFLFGSNYPITLYGQDDNDAFWDRMIIIPFLYSIDSAEADHDLLDKLIDEKDQIASYCLRKFCKVFENNYTFSRCCVADEMKRQWRGGKTISTDTFNRFISECTELTGLSEDEVLSEDLFNAYQTWCDKYEIEFALPRNNAINYFNRNLPEACIRKRIHHNKNENPKFGYSGIKLRKHLETDKSII